LAQKTILDKLSIYIPQSKIEQKPVERLIKLGEKGDRSVNYLVVQAIMEYLEREEKKWRTPQQATGHLEAEPHKSKRRLQTGGGVACPTLSD